MKLHTSFGILFHYNLVICAKRHNLYPQHQQPAHKLTKLIRKTAHISKQIKNKYPHPQHPNSRRY
jgi:hypothetical protein